MSAAGGDPEFQKDLSDPAYKYAAATELLARGAKPLRSALPNTMSR